MALSLGGPAAHRAVEAAALVAALASVGCARAPARVVLVTIDSLRADHVGPRAEGPSLTPSLDALARDGVTFADAITNCTVTRCSHASLLTGLYPWRHGLLDNSGRIGDVAALPALLQRRGVATGAVVSSLPLKGLLPGFDSAHEGFGAAEEGRRRYPVKRPEQTTQAAVQFLDAHPDGPFFLWIHYFPPHGPYTPPAAFLDADPAAAGPRLEVGERNYEKARIPAYQALPGILDAQEYRRRYAAHVRYVDAFVGRLLDRLRERGLYDDALVIATSDHGESLGEHGWYFLHGNLVYQEQARVPLIVKWPRGTARGTRSSAPVELVDVAPTVASMLALPGFAADGQALRPSAGAAPRLRFTQSNDAELVAILDGARKLIMKRGPTTYTDAGYPALELFHLDRDPLETSSVRGDDAVAAARLEAELRRRYAGVVGTEPGAPENEEALRALGYVN
ncbi:MAG TPA: sulfatase [Vicinamibacteria bacterium]|nr:sulfatase [Vicinamibacteria bacterium]